MRIKICVFLLGIMTCFCGYAFASGKSIDRMQEKMQLAYLEVMQSKLDSGVKALVVVSLLPAFEHYRTTADFKHMDWPWDDDDDDDNDDDEWPWDDDDEDDDDDDEDSGNELICVYEAISTMIGEVQDCDSDFACILVNVSSMVVEIASCTE